MKIFTCGEAGDHVLHLHLKKAQIQRTSSSLSAISTSPANTQRSKVKDQKPHSQDYKGRVEKVISVICVLIVNSKRGVCELVSWINELVFCTV